jgi:hypothetical protein
MTSYSSRRESLIQRAAESLKHSEHAERLGGALAGLAAELADARRQIALLKRENATLRTQIQAQADSERLPAPHRARPSDRVQTKVGIGGRRRE